MRSRRDWCREHLLRRIDTVRFPYLVGLAATLFVVDLVFPDVILWVDEILLGLATSVLARSRRKLLPETAPEFHVHAA